MNRGDGQQILPGVPRMGDVTDLMAGEQRDLR